MESLIWQIATPICGGTPGVSIAYKCQSRGIGYEAEQSYGKVRIIKI